jgi:hypothetical protein
MIVNFRTHKISEYIIKLTPIYILIKNNNNNNKKKKKRSASWFKRFQYDEVRDSPRDARVVVALIAAVLTFQAGVDSPGGAWQERHHGGRAINYASQKRASYVFLVSNTLALSTCILVVTSLTYSWFPFHLEIWVATASMMIAYASAVFAAIPHESVHFRYLLVAAFSAFCDEVFGLFLEEVLCK